MTDNKPDLPEQTTTEPAVNLSRRKLSTAALAGPVVLGTLASKQALGGTFYHCTISGQISGNASPRPGENISCTTLGRSPGFWKNHTACWGLGTINGKTGPHIPFNAIFTGSDTSHPMGDIIRAQCHVGTDLERAAVASYLNALHFHTNDPAYPLSTDQVVALFNNAGGIVTPGCDVKCYFVSLYSDSEAWPAGYTSSNCPSKPHAYSCSGGD